jgi:hypothetical protein
MEDFVVVDVGPGGMGRLELLLGLGGEFILRIEGPLVSGVGREEEEEEEEEVGGGDEVLLRSEGPGGGLVPRILSRLLIG